MTTTIAVLNQKGGVGKTTLATNLAAAAHLDARRTLVIDHDPQGSALDWSAARADGSKLDGLVVTKADRALPLRRIREMSEGFTCVVLDAPPRIGDITRTAAAAADVVLIPTGASQMDLWALDETFKLLDGADAIRADLGRPPVRRCVALNRALAGSQLARMVAAVLDEHTLVGTVHHRVAFPAATAVGESVLTTEAEGAAAIEIRRLWRAVRGVA